MRDPVTLATGITYDRASIERWLFTDGHATCPVTRRALAPAEMDATPNHTLRRLIQACGQQDAADDDFVLDSPTSTSSPAEDALGVLYSLQPSERSLAQIMERDGDFLDALASVLRRPSYRSRAYGILLLKAMTAVLTPARLMTVSASLVQEVVRVVSDRVSSKAVRAALRVLCRLCPWGRNRVKAVEAGAVAALVDLLLDEGGGRVSDLAVVAIDHLCGCAEGGRSLSRTRRGWPSCPRRSCGCP
ncbi:unnamed protein product [Miscanthus lutarioriparius]|uniref:U-box domain-containing protein n=1 Tax=Miscanthus lutarioriparius TaxID=422564 RepID=A0A811SQD5_9POAL|nr:unnamed protein product [Miscanthus lutarioriparius]